MIDLEEILEDIDPSGEWEVYDPHMGMDALLSHCGGPLETDIAHCPECGALNPLREAGLI